MKKTVSLLRLLGSTLLLSVGMSACLFGGHESPDAERDDNHDPVPTTYKTFVAAINYDSNDVSMFSMDAATGELTQVGSNIGVGTNPSSIAIDPAGKHVYVTNSGDDNITMLSMNPATGALSPGQDFSAGVEPQAMAMDSSGNYIYVANQDAAAQTSGNVQVFSISATTGALTLAQSVTSGIATQEPNALRLNSDGTRMYLGMGGNLNFKVYSVSSTNGQLSELAGAEGGAVSSFGDFAFAPSGKFFYALSADVFAGTNLIAYSLASDGTPTELEGYTTGADPYFLSIDPTGKFVYVANDTDGSISAFSANSTTGLLSSIETKINVADTYAIAIDPTGKFLFTGNGTTNNMSVFAINPTTGALTATQTVAAGSNVSALAIARVAQ